MCGILYSSFPLSNEEIEKSEFNVIRRGPDHKKAETINNQTYAHYLLHITGKKTPQPLRSGDSVLVYNGEVYNYENFGSFPSDGLAILQAFNESGVEGLRMLDGEFSGVISQNGHVFVFRDTFGTKPIFLGEDERGIVLSSYASQLRSLGFSRCAKLPVNTILDIDLKNNTTTPHPYRQFDLIQRKKNFDDWEKAFYASIEKRTKNRCVQYFIGLSSGYDSGLISCILNELGIDYQSYSILAAEDEGTLRARGERAPQNEFFRLSQGEYMRQKRFLQMHCEPYTTPPRPTRTNGYSVLEDKGAVGTGVICEKAKQAGCKVYISGQGSDEILSDYGYRGEMAPGFLHSTIAGHFPPDLERVFPWENVFGGTQEEFLAKDENVGGTYGLECRYPFLDFDLVQEFLWLHQDLKNSNYKSPIFDMLTKREYPLAPKGLYGKVGFRANKF